MGPIPHPAHELLDHLTDREDLDAVLELVTLDEVAESWCAYAARHSEQDDPNWWAIAFFFMRPLWTRDRSQLLRQALLALLDHAATDFLIGCVGAGPLENYVSDNEDDLRWIEAQAPTNPRLRQALANVYCSLEVAPETLARLDKAAGARLKRPS